MHRYVALLRAVNVGGTGKLAMTELKAFCEEAGFQAVRTYIASGNVMFHSAGPEAAVKAVLEARMAVYAGKPVGVLVRSAEEMAAVVARNPFADKPGNRTVALFVDGPLSQADLDAAKAVQQEQMRLGEREVFIFYGDGMADSRLRLPIADRGTARNMNTVAKLAAMAAE